MSRLTIIIPFFRDTTTEAFEETLASVLAHRPDDVEIIVANGSDYSDPWNTVLEGVRFLSLVHLSNPIDILNESVRQANGEILHILYPGTEVTMVWTDTALKYFESPQIGIVIPSVYDRKKQKRVFSFGIQYTSGGCLRTIRRSHWAEASGKRIVPHISAVFFRKTALGRAGLFSRFFMPQISYVDMAMLLEEQNWKTVVDKECRIMVCPSLLPASNAFSWGVQIERLYFRWLGRGISFSTLGYHFASFFTDFWRQIPKFRTFLGLFGRCHGLFYCLEVFSPKHEMESEFLVEQSVPLPSETVAAKKIA